MPNKFTLPDNLIATARQTAAAMPGHVAPLPDCSGMTLVRCDTPEAADRQADTAALVIPITIDRIPYLICSR